ncbi:MAG: ABC transporter ATP-binding protein [Planctomycetota bacterium]
MTHIRLDDVHLQFKVRQQRKSSLKDMALRWITRSPAKPQPLIHALNGVSLVLREGDRIGIIGHNGAGKSTLLKLMAGIYFPTAGRRSVTGSISTLLEIGMGIEPDATGWENMAYRGYLQGQSPRQIRAKMQGIAEFSELGHFLDLPVRCYSAGMLVRLAFSIATAIEPEILLIDEIFSAGDLSFQEKAKQRMPDLISKARILVLASHDLEALPSVCNRIVWMEGGRIREIGEPERILATYREFMKSYRFVA